MIFKRTTVQDKAYSSFLTTLKHITRTKQEQEEEKLSKLLVNNNTRHSRYRLLSVSCTPVFLLSKSYPNSTKYYNKPILLSFNITTLNTFECTTLLDILNQFLKLSLITFFSERI